MDAPPVQALASARLRSCQSGRPPRRSDHQNDAWRWVLDWSPSRPHFAPAYAFAPQPENRNLSVDLKSAAWVEEQTCPAYVLPYCLILHRSQIVHLCRFKAARTLQNSGTHWARPSWMLPYICLVTEPEIIKTGLTAMMLKYQNCLTSGTLHMSPNSETPTQLISSADRHCIVHNCKIDCAKWRTYGGSPTLPKSKTMRVHIRRISFMRQ